jgi:hypothetical protein
MKTRNATSPNKSPRSIWTRTVWESFCADHELRRLHAINEAEMRALDRVSMLGNVLSKQDYIFILTMMRESRRKP